MVFGELMKKSKIRVRCVYCPKCHDYVFSRAQHDYRSCSCGYIFVDGGFSYLRYGCNSEKFIPKTIRKLVAATKLELYQDWNKKINKFGIIKDK